MQGRTKQRANRQLPSFDRSRFEGPLEKGQYDEVWNHKSVVVERWWRVNEFHGEEFKLQQNFEERNWLAIAQFSAKCIPEVVREFFANIKENSISKRKGRETLTSWVRGVEIKLTPKDFAEVFQLPRVPQPQFTYPAEGGPPLSVIAREVLTEDEEWGGEYRKPVSALNAKYWALHMFSCTNILPQNRNSDCHPNRARLIYAIGTGMTIDLPSFIWHQIVHTFENPGGQAGIPFGGALTDIFRRKDSQLPTDVPFAPCLQPLTAVSYAKSRGNLSRSKKKKRADESSSHNPWEDVEEEDDTTFAMADLRKQLNRLERKQASDHGLLIEMQQNQMTMMQEQQRQTQLLHNLTLHLQNHPPQFPPS